MAKSSINLQIADKFAFYHNSRQAYLSYVIDDSSKNEYDKNGDDAFNYFLELQTEAITNYTVRTGQRIQTKESKILWEAVINLNKEHTLEDVKRLANVLNLDYGWQVVQVAVHNDEGYIDEKTGEKMYNHHAHIVFFMLDKKGIYRFKKRDFGIKKMQELQSKVANILKMERGVSKKTSKTIRLAHRQYKQMKRLEKDNEYKVENLQQQVDELSLTLSQLKQNKKNAASAIRRQQKNLKNSKSRKELESFLKKYIDLIIENTPKDRTMESVIEEDEYTRIQYWAASAVNTLESLHKQNKELKNSNQILKGDLEKYEDYNSSNCSNENSTNLPNILPCVHNNEDDNWDENSDSDFIQNQDSNDQNDEKSKRGNLTKCHYSKDDTISDDKQGIEKLLLRRITMESGKVNMSELSTEEINSLMSDDDSINEEDQVEIGKQTVKISNPKI